MLYLDLGLNNEDFLSDKEKESTSLIRKIKVFFRKYIFRIFEYEISGRSILVLSKLDKSLYKKLKKEFDLDVTKTVCISDELLVNDEFIDFLNKQNIKILDGKWLLKFLCLDIINYIVFNKTVITDRQESQFPRHPKNILSASKKPITGISCGQVRLTVPTRSFPAKNSTFPKT